MKKFFSVLLISIFAGFSIFSISIDDFSLSVEPFTKLRNGQVDELVFLKNSPYPTDKLSELNWEIKNEVILGAKISGGWKNFFQETSFSFGIPHNRGLMKDSDWLNIQFSGQSDSLYKTHYSESSNRIDSDFSIDIKGGYDFSIKENYHIKPSIGFEYHQIKFIANGGTLWYGEEKATGYYAYNSSNVEIKKISGDVIDYKRISEFLWLGTDFHFDLPKNFILDGGLFFSPYAYVVSFDTHIIREQEFADLTIGYLSAFKGNILAGYKINERHSISLGFEFFYLKQIRGNSFSKSTKDKYYVSLTSTNGGASSKWFDFTLSYRFKIF